MCLPSLYGAPYLSCWRQPEIRRRNSPVSGLRNSSYDWNRIGLGVFVVISQISVPSFTLLAAGIRVILESDIFKCLYNAFLEFSTKYSLPSVQIKIVLQSIRLQSLVYM